MMRREKRRRGKDLKFRQRAKLDQGKWPFSGACDRDNLPHDESAVITKIFHIYLCCSRLDTPTALESVALQDYILANAGSLKKNHHKHGTRW